MIAIIWPTRKLPRDVLVDATDLGVLATVFDTDQGVVFERMSFFLVM